MTDLIVRGGALPTFLLERIAAATDAASVVVQPPQCVIFRGAYETAAFAPLVPLMAAEGLNWRFAEAGDQPSFALPDIDALLFDFGNVVVEIDFRRAFSFWANAAKVSAEQVAARFVASCAYEAHERGEIDGAAYFAALRDELGIDLTDADFLEGWNRIFLAPVAGMPQLLARLAALRPLYLFSNTNAMHHAYWARAYASVLTPFSGVFCSHELGARKPAKASFQVVANHIGLPPERIVFFDDLEENVVGARLAGMTAFQVTRADQVIAALKGIKIQPAVES